MAIEMVVVALLFVVVSFFYLRPATTELLRGNAKVMIGDGTDSVTNPWAYRLVVDVAKSRPHELLYAALYSDQVDAPQGMAAYVTFIERMIVLLLAPFMRTDLMPTAVVWILMVLTGLAFHAYGRALGWPRVIAFSLAMAWAICPFTRGRAVVHAGMVGMYWAPFLFMALTLLARPPKHLTVRAATIVAAVLILVAVFAGHYFVMMSALLSPVFLLYYLLLLPSGASRVGALGRLAIAIAPAVVFLLWSVVMTLPAQGARAMSTIKVTRTETPYMIRAAGAHPSDYVAGDVKLGDSDVIPARSRLTKEIRAAAPLNRHERTNGIRWSVLACCAALAVTLCVRRFRRRLSRSECILGGFAFVLAVVAFLFALSPQGLRIYDVDLGPIQLVAKQFPRFRVPNRIGTLVHFAALLGAGVFLTRVMKKKYVSAVVPLVVVLDYPPLEPVTMADVVPARTDLEAVAKARGEACGAGLPVPFVTAGFRDEDYYQAYTSLRGTSCKMLHTSALTREDLTMRLMVGEPMFNQGDRMRAIWLTRCTNAKWVMFRLSTPEDRKREFCAELSWSFVAPDVCRAPKEPLPLPPDGTPGVNRDGSTEPRSLRECIDRLEIAPTPEMLKNAQ